MDESMVTSHSARAARDVLTLWRGCYHDARLIDTPWADGDRALAIVHALDFGCYDRVDGSDDAGRDSTGNSASGGTDDPETECRGVLLNGLLVRSPLAAPTGTYTAERATNVEGRPWVHLYRACVPDLPGTSGRRSSAQVYVKALEAAGLDMATNASLFTGLCWPMGRGLQAQMRVVTHQNVGLDPIEFARRTLVALGAAERAVRRRAARAIAAADAVTDAIEHEIDRLRTRILVACESATASHVPITSSLSSSALTRRHLRDTATTRQKREPRDQSGCYKDRQSTRERRRHRDDRHRDDCVEPVWCATHERWERASVSCADRATTTTASLADTTSSTTQSASESATTESSCYLAVPSSSASLTASSRPLACSSSSLTSSAPSRTLSSEHPVSSSSSSSSSSSPSVSSSVSSTTQSSCESGVSSQASEMGTTLREPHLAIGIERAHRIGRAAEPQVAFDITECSEDIYSCCSECCSSSGCSCSVDGHTRDTSSTTGAAD